MSQLIHIFASVVVGAVGTLVGCMQVVAGEEDIGDFRFIQQQARNNSRFNVCLGLTRAIECLEEGKEIKGVESSVELSRRIWNALNDPDAEQVVYPTRLQLRNGETVQTCSKAAIEELALIIQQEYKGAVDEFWQTGKAPNLSTKTGRALVGNRKKYMRLNSEPQPYQITSLEELKKIYNEDADGLLALSGRGQRLFYRGVPDSIKEKASQRQGPRALKESNAVPSFHAFLLTYDEDANQFYVYDSDDPDGKWPVTVEGNGICPVREWRIHPCEGFRIHWRIEDHLGNGPTRQTYCNVRPLKKHLYHVRRLIEDDPAAAQEDTTANN